MWDATGTDGYHTQQGIGGTTVFPAKGIQAREAERLSIDNVDWVDRDRGLDRRAGGRQVRAGGRRSHSHASDGTGQG